MGIKIKQLLNQSNKMVESVRTPLNERTVSTTAVKSPSVYGDQPRSLNIHWMKYDVTDKENYSLNHSVVSAPSKPAKLSPLRKRLAEKGEKVMKKRQLLTLAEIEAKIEEARLRKDYAKADALAAQVLARMNRAMENKIKHAYLLQKANLRFQTEETKEQNLETQKTSLKKRQQQVQIRRVKADERESSVSSSSAQGLEGLNQMNVDLESLIRQVYKKM